MPVLRPGDDVFGEHDLTVTRALLDEFRVQMLAEMTEHPGECVVYLRGSLRRAFNLMLSRHVADRARVLRIAGEGTMNPICPREKLPRVTARRGLGEYRKPPYLASFWSLGNFKSREVGFRKLILASESYRNW